MEGEISIIKMPTYFIGSSVTARNEKDYPYGNDNASEDTTDVGIWNRKQRYYATRCSVPEPKSTENRQPKTKEVQRKSSYKYHRLTSPCKDGNRPKSFSETDSRQADLTLVHSDTSQHSVTGQDIRHIEELLILMAGTKFSSLLRHLVGIETYLTPSSLTQAINFLYDMFDCAIEIKHSHPDGSPIVPVNDQLLPSVFHLDVWKDLMILFGFFYEEVGTQNRIKYCTLFMPASVKISVLQGMLSLLKCMLVLQHDNLRTLMVIQNKEANLLLRAIMTVQSGQADASKWVAEIWNSYSDLCRGLGFTKLRNGHSKHYVYQPNTEKQDQQLLASQAVLETFHGIKDDVKETTI